MRNLTEIAADMRDLAEMLSQTAGELDKFAEMMSIISANFNQQVAKPTGGKLDATKKASGRGNHGKPNKLNEQQKAELRKFWNSQPAELQTIELKRSLAQRYQTDTRMINLYVSNNLNSARQEKQQNSA